MPLWGSKNLKAIAARGWDSDGRPTAEKLRELGIESLAPEAAGIPGR